MEAFQLPSGFFFAKFDTSPESLTMDTFGEGATPLIPTMMFHEVKPRIFAIKEI